LTREFAASERPKETQRSKRGKTGSESRSTRNRPKEYSEYSKYNSDYVLGMDTALGALEMSGDELTNSVLSSTKVLMKKKSRSESYVFEVKITLQGLQLPIWRTVLVEKTTSLGDLHFIIQEAMGWQNEHLHLFNVGKRLYSPGGSEEQGPREKDEESVDIQKLAIDRVRQFGYEYDFGDGWRHTIEIVRRVPRDPSGNYPQCIGGERACPPEDSGGVWGFEEKLDALKNDSDEQLKEWMGDFDPDEFDIDKINKKLQGTSFDKEEISAFGPTCGFCGSPFAEDQEIIELGTSIDGEVDTDQVEDEILPFKMEGVEQLVLGILVGKESAAKKAGDDLVFQVCSDKCLQALQKALTHEISCVDLE
jgi:hypothetical protein